MAGDPSKASSVTQSIYFALLLITCDIMIQTVTALHNQSVPQDSVSLHYTLAFAPFLAILTVNYVVRNRLFVSFAGGSIVTSAESPCPAHGTDTAFADQLILCCA